MKLLFVIDHFGSGGAQKQIVTLAKCLRERNFDIEFFIYYPQYDFFRSELERLHITIHSIEKRNRGFSFRVLLGLRKILSRGGYDCVISFLDTPNIYTELAGAGISGLNKIVSERNSYLLERSRFYSRIKRRLHSMADFVVANSQTQASWLKDKHPWLKNKVVTIYNGFSADEFKTGAMIKEPGILRLIGIGRIAYQKNQVNLIHALQLFYERHKWCPHITWVGSLESSAEPDYKKEVFQLLEKYPRIGENWIWTGESSNVPALLNQHHALILPSHFEGLPNVIGEALFSGLPVLTSDVCDNPRLVADNTNGYLFDPRSPSSISTAIEKLNSMTSDQWHKMSLANREFAEKNLSVNKMVSGYVRLLRTMIQHEQSAG
jgi:glycosyltransferase involved in cell wall biosynthesis